MIELKFKDRIYEGGYREIYQHPANENICLKILKKEALARAIKRKKRYTDENMRDYEAYRILSASIGEKYCQYIPKCYGFMETSLGTGLAVGLVRNHDGTPSRNLQEWLTEHTEAKPDAFESVRSALCEFFDFFYYHGIVTRKFQTFNLTVQRKTEGYQIWLVDGLGNSDFLPLSHRFSYFAKKKVKRQINYFYSQHARLRRH